MAKVSKEERQESIDRLHQLLKPGDTVHVILKHVARSGMYRVMGFYLFKVIKGKIEKFRLDGLVSDAVGHRYDTRHNGVGVGGRGMDMGFAVVYDLARTLFPKGGSLKHSPRAGQHRNGQTRETDGGYLLRHEWLG